jgi:hypothetical protein
MSHIFNGVALAEPEAEELVELPDAEDFDFAEKAEKAKQESFDAGRGV